MWREIARITDHASRITHPASRFENTLYKPPDRDKLAVTKRNIMRKTFLLFAVVVVLAALASGCANAERKFGRGMSNTFDIVRAGEFRRTMEQTALFEGPDAGYTTGVVRGFNRTLARTGIGLYEVVTAPLPPYGPIFTSHFAPGPVYPDNFTPGLLADSAFSTDTFVGFSGGEVFPFLPGSRYRIFDTP